MESRKRYYCHYEDVIWEDAKGEAEWTLHTTSEKELADKFIKIIEEKRKSGDEIGARVAVYTEYLKDKKFSIWEVDYGTEETCWE